MTTLMLREILGWCIVINIAILFFWFFIMAFAHETVYKLHSKWFKISIETFDAIHYAGMAFFKVVIIFFNVVPYLALIIIM